MEEFVKINTENDIELIVGISQPHTERIINGIKITKFLESEFGLFISGIAYTNDGEEFKYEYPVFLNKKEAKRLYDELEKFINTPF